MPLIQTRQGREFTLEGEESLLDAASRAGLNYPYSCRSGRCSTCRCQVVSGDTRALLDETGLTPDEVSRGFILSCVRTANSDSLVLDFPDLGDVPLSEPKTVPCRIQTIERPANDVVEVTLRLPPTANFVFLPGQYIDVIGPGGIRRSYSLANAIDEPLMLQIRQVESGVMSQYWFEQAKPNDLLRLHGPLGTFFLRDLAGKDLIFLATGTGIAPVRSMWMSLSALPEDQRPRSVSVYWGGRHPEDLYWQPEEALLANAMFHPVLSRAGNDWQGRQGYVQQALIEDRSDFADCRVYACGSEDMIHSASQLLIEHGLSEDDFLADAFVCSAKPE